MAKEKTMITGIHALFFSSQVEELREFIRDKLGFPYNDAGKGWLIFDLPRADMGCHPAADRPGKESGVHDISFYCDDINATVTELKSRGVEFADEITDQGYGYVARFIMPGGIKVDLFQPHYPVWEDK